MDEIIEKPDSFSDEPEEIVDQPDRSSEQNSEKPEVVSNDKVARSETLVNSVDNKVASSEALVNVADDNKKVESCTVVLPKSEKPREGSFMSYLMSHPLLLLLAVVCLVAVVYLILDFLRGFFPWMQN